MSGQCPVFDIIVKEQVIMSKFDRLFITASAELYFVFDGCLYLNITAATFVPYLLAQETQHFFFMLQQS